jgi:membrane-associated phospholipid phosphatase
MPKSILFILIFFFEIYSSAEAAASSPDTTKIIMDSIKISLHPLVLENKNELNIEWYQMVADIPVDEYSFFRNSLQISQIPTYAGLTLITGSLMKVDQSGWKVDGRLYEKSYSYRTASNLFVDMGNGGFHFLLSGLFASYGLIFTDPAALKTASDIGEAVLSTGLMVQVLKRVTGRESPAYASNSRWKWQFFPSIKEYQKDQSKYYSFPSGHLASGAATLTVIANNYPGISWLKPVGYSILGMLGIGLVSKGMHWYSDLPFGYFIGYSMGNIVSPELKSPVENLLNLSQMSFGPEISAKRIGFQAGYSF